MQADISGNINFTVTEHSHGTHSHINIVHPTDKHASGLKSSDEGCPCCAIGVDLDEVAAAASEMGKGRVAQLPIVNIHLTTGVWVAL